MHVHPRQTVIGLLGLCTVACSDGTGSLGFVTLCPNSISWAGIQREGEPWQTISNTRSALPLRAGERIGLARIRQGYMVDSLQIFYVTAEQAEATFACETAATKELHGTVQGFGTSTAATVTMGNSSVYAGPDFTLRLVPNGPADLIATRFAPGPATIIRRGVDYPNGSTIPVLDFNSSESFGLLTNTLTVVGASAFERSAMTQIITERGTQGMLGYTGVNNDSPLPIYSVPDSRLLNGELNSLTVFAPIARVAVLYYRVPSDRTVELGPLASAATFTRSGTFPDQSLRIDMPSQPEYASQIAISLCFGPFLGSESVTTLIGSKEYFGGTPATWSLTVPDMLSVQGFPSSRLDPRQMGRCEVLVTGRPYLLSPRTARDGDTYRSAMASF